MFTHIREVPPESLLQLQRNIRQLWADGPRIFGDSPHPDSYARDSSVLVGDYHLVKLIQDYQVHGPVWNQFYPWGRGGHFTRTQLARPILSEANVDRAMHVNAIYDQLPADVVESNNFSYAHLLDLLFGLENLALVGIADGSVMKDNYELSRLPQLFQATLDLAYRAGFPVPSMVKRLSSDSMSYKEVGKSTGYMIGFKGDWNNPLSVHFHHYDQFGPTNKISPTWDGLTQLVYEGKVVPTKGSTELACMLTNGLAGISLHHFGNQNASSLEPFGEISARYGLVQSQITQRNKDRWALVVDENGKAITLPDIYIRFGRLPIHCLIACVYKKAPLTINELQQFLTVEV